jgi:hypothetical protein
MAAFRKVTKVPNKKGNIFDATNDFNRSNKHKKTAHTKNKIVNEA